MTISAQEKQCRPDPNCVVDDIFLPAYSAPFFANRFDTDEVSLEALFDSTRFALQNALLECIAK